MAERKYKRYRVIDTEPVQGEGSWVKLKQLTWGEMRPLIESSAENIDVLAASIVDWNWVDDDGNPLPLPSVDPSVMRDVLTQVEINFIANAGQQHPDKAERKN